MAKINKGDRLLDIRGLAKPSTQYFVCVVRSF